MSIANKKRLPKESLSISSWLPTIEAVITAIKRDVAIV